MKNNIPKALFSLLLILVFTSCEHELVEENHSNLTPEFFNSPEGLEKGLNAAYAGLRTFYGPEEGIEAFTIPGTDEFQISNGSRPREVAFYSSNYTSENEFSRVLWNNAYTFINTCNGLIDFGSEITDIDPGVKQQLLAEAKFLRAFYYFKLVQFYGDVTLNIHYNNSPTTSATREDKSAVYELIIDDLQQAMPELALSPQLSNIQAGRATVAAAKHLLAKVYLTRGYSDVSESTDFDQALELSSELINQAGSMGIGLLDDFGKVFEAQNENNQEVLLNVQYSADKTYGGGHPLNHLFVTNYQLQLGERTIADGRPFVWYRGTDWLYNTVFADKVNDTRYYNSFQSVWYAPADLEATYTLENETETFEVTVNVKQGDTAMYLPGYELSKSEILAKNYYTYTPRFYTNLIYPTMTKFLDPNRLTPNENSHRPIIIFRFAETYLIAAEAALNIGRLDEAATYINVIRQRAAAQGKEEQMKIDASNVTLDFILDERARELAGENMRWLDLVRTKTLLERVRLYGGTEAANNIQDFHVLRPVPQEQINRVITGTPYPQNQGW
ncbi:RagB/SusD family nutrient uptake outer membrane protein [Galbibacter sp.]|uniref:RagB/SusD family nutrient uptake outer membrane protein n=1 Tax=Galbibacter sp. TaxID=2918471 RepID=UPI003A93A41F